VRLRTPALMCALALGVLAEVLMRDADAVAVFSLLAAVGLLLWSAGGATAAWVTRAQIGDVFFAMVRVGVLCVAGPIGWGRGESTTDPRVTGLARRARTVARGIIMATPALLLLSALLMSADPVFDRVIQNLFRIDLETLVEHLLVSAAIAWLTAGFLRAFMIRDDVTMDRLFLPQPAFQAAEVSVALWILNLLFVVFMAVQLRYLFGGANLVEVTDGLS